MIVTSSMRGIQRNMRHTLTGSRSLGVKAKASPTKKGTTVHQAITKQQKAHTKGFISKAISKVTGFFRRSR